MLSRVCWGVKQALNAAVGSAVVMTSVSWRIIRLLDEAQPRAATHTASGAGRGPRLAESFIWSGLALSVRPNCITSVPLLFTL